MGRHAVGDDALAWVRHPGYEPRHVDFDRQPSGRGVDGIPDEWFDPWIERKPDDPDLGVR